MTLTRNPLHVGISRALMLGLSGSLAALSSQSMAQDDADDTAQLDRVQVTGSRISRADIEGANPVTVLDRDDIERTGTIDLGELIQSLPSVNGSFLTTQRNNGGSGAVSVNLRGLGANRTLVLINGRREPSFGDFSTFPIAMVERVEVLKDGASAIYGADAVAGVVNVITRRDFEGAELELQIGESFDEGGQVRDASFVTGGSTDRGNFVIGIDYSEIDEAFQSAWDDEFLNVALTVYDADEYAATGLTPFNTDVDGNGLPGLVSLGSSRIPNGRFRIDGGPPVTLCDGADPTDTSSYTCAPGTYNYAPLQYLQTPFDRSNFFFQGDYELFDNVDAYLEGRFSNRESELRLAPLPYDSRFDPAFDDQNNIAIAADNFYNPFGVPITEFRRRVVETGGRRLFREINQWQLVTGLTGDLGARWTWDLGFNYGRRTRSDTDFGQFFGPNVSNAFGPSFQDPESGEILCGTPDNVIAGCVPFNAFGGPGTISQDMLDYLSIPLNDRYTTERQIFNATLVGDLFDLPAGVVGTAVGFERRKEEFRFDPDSAKVAGQVTGNTGAGTAGSYDVDSLFGELSIPLLADQPGAELLELNLSGRYDDFSTFGSTETFQGGIRWQPIPGLLLRGTYNEVFREPNISELFAGVADSFNNATDPCNDPNPGDGIGVVNPACPNGVPDGFAQSDSQVRSRVGGNPDLPPEEGDTLTLGLAWSPDFLQGFSLTVDYWEVQLDTAINTPTTNVVLAGCSTGARPEFCDNISRRADGALDEVLRLRQPVGEETAVGWDFSANYDLNTDIGLWNFRWLATRLDERELITLRDSDGDGLPDADNFDVVGRYEHRSLGAVTGYPEWKHQWSLDWSLGNFSAGAELEYIDSLVECGSPFDVFSCPDDAGASGSEPQFDIDEVWYLDLVGRYTVPGWGSRISLGVTNVTDEDFPFINQGDPDTFDPDIYRAFGRSWFVNLKHSF